MITSIKNKEHLTPVEIKMLIQKEFSAADYVILRNMVSQLSDYGLRAGGSVVCPKCGNHDATYFTLIDDKFFRPSMGDMQEWKNSRNREKEKNVPPSKTATV